MKSARALFSDVNYILRLVEGVLCLGGLIYYHKTIEVMMTLSFHGWFFIALCYLLAYVWEDPNVGMEIFALGMYAVFMLLTAFRDVSVHSILPTVLGVLLIADLTVTVVMKGSK